MENDFSNLGATYWTSAQFAEAISSGDKATQFLAKLVLSERPRKFSNDVQKCLENQMLIEEERELRGAIAEELSSWSPERFAKEIFYAPDQNTQFIYLHHLSQMPISFREEVKKYGDNPGLLEKSDF